MENNVQTSVFSKLLVYLRLPIIWIVFGVLVLVLGSLYLFSLDKPPADFPVRETIVIEKGATIRDVSVLLDENDIVRSRLYLQFLLSNSFADDFIQPGAYTFPKPLSALEIAKAVTSGTHSTPHKNNVVTFPEGFRVANMHDHLPERFANEPLERFVKYEGYLFPDTYYIEDDDTLGEIVDLMRTNFDTRIAQLEDKIDSAYYSLDEIVTLASILEREANSKKSMRIVAGILLKRLEGGMPLQVDATFEYVLGKTSAELTEEDLEMDSPYNTYTQTGLPPTPISNPGLVAIRAILDPIETEYYYYLSDADGNFHYAKTFEEHKQNKFQYLR